MRADPWAGVQETSALRYLRKVRTAKERYQLAQRRVSESLVRLGELDVRLVPPVDEPDAPWLSVEQLRAIVEIEQAWTAMLPALRSYDDLLRASNLDGDPAS